jgi:hypothetical protein
MDRRVSAVALIFCVFTGFSAATALQPSPDDERRDAIRLLRAINTAENRVRGAAGKYVPLIELLEHGSMGGVKPDITVSGGIVTHKGAQIRLALSADATQYVVTVVSGAPNHTAAFTDERGVIYTGKALQ